MSLASSESSVRGNGPLVTGEFAFSREDFRHIADVVQSEAGIVLQEAKATLVYSRLTKRLRALSIRSFNDYCAYVAGNADERNRMIASLTTNVTSFFREPHHFEDLKKAVVQPLAEAARRGERIRLWSAACSSGQEPYSMALTILSVIPEAAKLDIKILATDLNPEVVERGRRGIYEEAEAQAVPSALRTRWSERVVDDGLPCIRMQDEVRSMVSFREFNLMGDWPMRGPFQAIFCRNVVIYFDRDTQSTIWRRLIQLLPREGTLYIGHSERVSGPAASLVQADGITTYRKTQ